MTYLITKPIRAIHFLVLAFLMTIVTQASAEGFKGRMDCTVKTNRVTEVSEGIGKEYAGFTDSFKVGSSLLFEYEFVNNRLEIVLTDVKEDSDFYRRAHGSEPGEVISLLSDNETVRAQYKGGQYISLSSDTIESEGIMVLESPLRLRFGKLYFNRYYKNDWEGLVYTGWQQELHVFTLDCRHKVDQLDDIIKSLTVAAGN